MVALDPRRRGLGSMIGTQVSAVVGDIAQGGSIAATQVRELTSGGTTAVGGTVTGIRYRSTPTAPVTTLSHTFTFTGMEGGYWTGSIIVDCRLGTTDPPAGEYVGITPSGSVEDTETLGPFPWIGAGGTNFAMRVPFETDGTANPVIVDVIVLGTASPTVTVNAKVSATRYG